jgi:hypothetical protein
MYKCLVDGSHWRQIESSQLVLSSEDRHCSALFDTGSPMSSRSSRLVALQRLEILYPKVGEVSAVGSTESVALLTIATYG